MIESDVSYKLNFKMESPPEYQSNTMTEIHKAQRTLDQIQYKLKSYKKQKNSIKKPIVKSDLPDLKEYLNYLIHENDIELEDSHLQMTKQRKKIKQANHKKTQKNYEEHFPEIQVEESFSLNKHTQEQLEKERLTNLQKIEIHYRENCDILDERINQLQKTREKLKKDKVLLMRDNEELQKKIQKLRKHKQNSDFNHPQKKIMNQMISVISDLKNKLLKLENENNKIRRRKKELQANMRNCIKSNQDVVRADLQSKSIKANKSKSMLTRCPYH